MLIINIIFIFIERCIAVFGEIVPFAANIPIPQPRFLRYELLLSYAYDQTENVIKCFRFGISCSLRYQSQVTFLD